MKLAVVIVNYRTPTLTLRAIETAVPQLQELDLKGKIYVVDGGSGDDSAAQIRAGIFKCDWTSSVEMIELHENRGFAAGNNAAIRTLLSLSDPPQYVWLLNPDTELREGAAKALVDFMDQHPSAGIAGSQLENFDGTFRCGAFRFHSFISEFLSITRNGFLDKWLSRYVVALPASSQNHRCDWVSGASMMIRKELFEETGLMDESYFLYYEETDFAKKAAKRHWECWFVPESRVIHIPGSSTGIKSTGENLTRRPAYWFESRRRYFQNHHGRPYLWLVTFSWLLGYLLSLARRLLRRNTATNPKRFLIDMVRHGY